jgi:hypothetical protein
MESQDTCSIYAPSSKYQFPMHVLALLSLCTLLSITFLDYFLGANCAAAIMR